MKKSTGFATSVLLTFLFIVDANASIMLTPADASWFGSLPKNPTPNDIAKITGFAGRLTSLYESEVGGIDDGLFVTSYKTTYFNTPKDPKDALIEWVGPFFTKDPQFLMVKDGNHNPRWYIFDLSYWDGLMDIKLSNFWPSKGAISSVKIFGGTSAGMVPEPASAIAWGILIPSGFGWLFIRRRLLS